MGRFEQRHDMIRPSVAQDPDGCYVEYRQSGAREVRKTGAENQVRDQSKEKGEILDIF